MAIPKTETVPDQESLEWMMALGKTWRLVRRYGMGIFAFGCLAGLSATLFTLVLSPRIYGAETSFFLGPVSREGMGASLRQLASAVGISLAEGRGGLPNELVVEILKSRRLAEQAFSRFPRLASLVGGASLQGAVARFRRKFLRVRLGREGLITVQVLLPGTPRIRSWQDLFSGQGANQRDADLRLLAAQVANEYREMLATYIEAMAVDETQAYLAAARRAFDQVQKDLERARTAWAAFQQEQTGPPVVPEGARPLIENLLALEKERALTEVGLRATETQLSQAQQQAQQQVGKGIGIGSYSPLLETLQGQLVELEVEIAQKQRALGPEHPELLQALHRREALEKEIQAEVQRLLAAGRDRILPQLAALEAQRLASQARLTALKREIAQTLDQLRSFTQLQNIARQKELELRIAETVYQTVVVQLKQAELEAGGRGLRLKVVDEAIPPERKSSPSTLKNAALGCFLGCLLGILWVWGMGMREQLAALETSFAD